MPACIATSENSWTIIIGVARTWACRRTRPSHAPSKHQKPVGSSRSQRCAGSIIVTNVVPPEPRTPVELSHSNKSPLQPTPRRAVSPTRFQGSRTQTDNSRSSTAYGSRPSSGPGSLRMLDRQNGPSCGRTLSDRVSENDRHQKSVDPLKAGAQQTQLRIAESEFSLHERED